MKATTTYIDTYLMEISETKNAGDLDKKNKKNYLSS